MKVYLETYGCSANQPDSEIMLGMLEEKGYQIVNFPGKENKERLQGIIAINQLLHKEN